MIKLNGVFTALITPFKNNELDLASLRALVRRQLDAGVHGFVPLGSTGEAATLTHDERARIIETVMDETKGKVPVIVGAGTNATTSSIENVRQAKALGADAAMLVTPYYNKPTDDGLFAHYKAVREAVDLPLLVYNVPGRTGMNLSVQCAKRLASIDGIIGIKEASGNVVQGMEIIETTSERWSLLSGEDMLFLPLLSVGATGIICTASNVIPKAYVNVYDCFKAGKLEEAATVQRSLLGLNRELFRVANPIPVKAAAALLGFCQNELRLPLFPLTGSGLDGLRQELSNLKLL